MRTQMTRTLVLAAVLIGLVAVGASPTVSKESCSSVQVLGEASSAIREKVLQEICEKMFDHVLLSGSSGGRSNSEARRATQAALLVLHSDSSNSSVAWDAGGERNVIKKKRWFVDEEVSLVDGYRWYSHGLPMWPFLGREKKFWGFLPRELQWPNYALATPLYLAPAEQSAGRDPRISVGKFLKKELERPRSDSVDSFSSPTVPKDIRKFVLGHFFGQAPGMFSPAPWRENADKDFEKYEHWFQPLVERGLRPMIQSFGKHHESKCPDETYVFFFRQPCGSLESCQVTKDIKGKLGKCPRTELVVGFLKPLAH